MIKPFSPLVDDIVSAICAAPASNDPFVHLAIDHVFPEDCHQAIVDCMPEWYD